MQVRDPSGRVVAAINSSGYSGKITAERLMTERLGQLQVSAARITQTFSRFPALLHSLV